MVLHDTTEFSFQRESPDRIGITYNVNSGRDKPGRIRAHTVCGILLHSSLAVTTDGLPLGLAAVKFWNRKKFKGTAALKRKVNPTRVPIEKKESIRWLENLKQSTMLLGEPQRCVHIGDRESDIYELFCTGLEIGTHFLVRTCVDRLAGNGSHTVAHDMAKAKIKGQHRIEVRDSHGDLEIANLEIKYERLQLLPPIGKQKQYPPLELTIMHALERGKPKNRKSIDWKLSSGSLCTCCRQYPGTAIGRTTSLNSPKSCQPSPIRQSGRPVHCPFRGLLGVHSRYGLHTRAVTVYRDTLSEGFSHFVTSMTAPVASGWSGCRVGLAPTGKRRLFTAHANSGHRLFGIA